MLHQKRFAKQRGAKISSSQEYTFRTTKENAEQCKRFTHSNRGNFFKFIKKTPPVQTKTDATETTKQAAAAPKYMKGQDSRRTEENFEDKEE